jgi:hypothetical protein
LKRNAQGKLVHANIAICSTDGIRNLALRRRNDANLEAARRSLCRHRIEDHDFTFMTLASTPKKMQAAKKKIRVFINELTEFLESGERTEVYELCTQFFPRTVLTKVSPKGGEEQKE